MVSEATAKLLYSCHSPKGTENPHGVGSHQIICIILDGISKSIKNLYLVILTKEKKKNMHHEVERQVTVKV